MPAKKLRQFLDEKGVRYETIPHTTTYTAQTTAQAVHIPGKEIAKTVVVKLDGRMAMAVLPASESVDLNRLQTLAGVKRAELATEHEFKDAFPECQVGAMPPFGNLYGMDVYVEKHLTEDEVIAFNAGTHTELIRLAYRDFERLVKPQVMEFSNRH